ncbi:MAG: hypothetical protein ACLFQB_14065 [Chitinispirillaceae bacterium]
MKKLSLVIFFLFISIQASGDWPWEKYGLSQTEWKMIKDNDIPIPKVEELLEIGVDISEYVQTPWTELGMREEKWLSKRRSGLSSYDIKLEAEKNRDHWSDDVKTGIGSDFRGVSRNSDLVSSLLLPGYQQIKAKRNVKGSIMVTLALGALTWSVAGSMKKGEFQVLPIGVVLIPDMLWSMIDFKLNNTAYSSPITEK